MKSLSDKKSRDELLKESRLLYKKLNAQMKEISKSKEPLLLDAYNRFKDFKKDFKYNDFSKYTENLVRDIHRDLNYIDSLKSSSLEGAEESYKTFGKTKEFLESLSKDKQNEFWETFEKIYKTTVPQKIYQYRYEVFDVVRNEMLLGQEPSDILHNLEKIIDDTLSPNKTEEEIDAELEEKLQLYSSELFEEIFDQHL